MKKNSYLLCLDLEATCQKQFLIQPQEIIHFAAVLIKRDTFESVAVFDEVVRPVHNPVLSEFCKSLTGLTQDAVNDAEPFPVVLSHFFDWLKEHHLFNNFTVVTWSNWDLTVCLTNQCALSDVPIPYCFKHWCNLKFLVNRVTGVHPKVSLKDIVTKFYGLPWVGLEHNGVDDATNLAQLLPFYAGVGQFLPITHLTDSARRKWHYLQRQYFVNK